MAGPLTIKLLEWVASAKADLISFPPPVRREVGFALYLAQTGVRALNAKPLKGFGGAGVLEIIADHDGSAYRAVYTVKFAKSVYVLHAFQKKSTKNIATRKSDLELIQQRLKAALNHYKTVYGDKPK
jgi:phage-related protein